MIQATASTPIHPLTITPTISPHQDSIYHDAYESITPSQTNTDYADQYDVNNSDPCDQYQRDFDQKHGMGDYPQMDNYEMLQMCRQTYAADHDIVM